MAMARSGKVRGQTPKVEPKDKQKKKAGRAGKRKLLNKRNAENENEEKEPLFNLVYNPPEKKRSIYNKTK